MLRKSKTLYEILVVPRPEASKRWKSIHHWKPALQSFQVMFGKERVAAAGIVNNQIANSSIFGLGAANGIEDTARSLRLIMGRQGP